MPNLDITTSLSDDGTGTVIVAGEVDMATADQLRAALSAAADHSPVRLDLTALRYLDSTGLRVLFEFADRLAEVVVPRDGPVPRVLALVALDRVLAVRTV